MTKPCRKATSVGVLKGSKAAEVPKVGEAGFDKRTLELSAHLGMTAIGRKQLREGAPCVVEAPEVRLHERGGDDHLAAGNDPSRFQYSLHLGQSGPDVRDVHEDGVTVCDVEGAVFEGEV